MLNKLKQLLGRLKSEEMEAVHAPTGQSASFRLMYRNLEIGTLSLSADGVWKYAYAEAFKKQQDMQPLIDFPNTKRVYENEELWPFFASRIPSANQPQVQQKAREKQLDTTNAVQMLQEFGLRTIANPFTLRPQGTA